MKDEKKLRPKSEDRKPIYAKKSFGQNFLVDQNYINKIISALNPNKDETIIEIGAGRGALTEKLVKSGANVLAIEFERDMIAVLRDKLGKYENFRLIEQDALKINFQAINNEQRTTNNEQRIKLVANLPYYISTAILQKLIEQRKVFSEMVLMFQHEVVERITAEAGNKERGFLTVLVEAYLETEKLFDVPPTAFRPAPKVWSSVVRLRIKDKTGIENGKLFREIISLGFRQKRKTILNNLKNFSFSNFEKQEMSQILEQIEISPDRRAETLSIDEWKRLVQSLTD
ncbi:MAG: ribosomal RNA small subunit methyltransferase A [Acidobacteria bacterium]|nr:ribosomal RNA small subunit methyltransferase A [Acidobacteriota bacterium]